MVGRLDLDVAEDPIGTLLGDASETAVRDAPAMAVRP